MSDNSIRSTGAPRLAQDFNDALLIGIGLSPDNLVAAINTLHPHFASLCVLISPTQKIAAQGAKGAKGAKGADEIWVAHRLGGRGALALIRRIAWRRFACVYQLTPAYHAGASFTLALSLALLRLLVVPRPPWCFSLPKDDISS